MNIRKRRNREVNVNLTPLIDVVFLLLIFFMISTTFKKQSTMAIQLPEVEPGHSLADKHLSEVAITASGEYWFNGKKLELQSKSELKKSLSSLDSSEPLVIIGDEQAPYKAVVSAMDAAQQLGLTHIKIMAREQALN
jgi:biopolymer transport protein ExbD